MPVEAAWGGLHQQWDCSPLRARATCPESPVLRKQGRWSLRGPDRKGLRDVPAPFTFSAPPPGPEALAEALTTGRGETDWAEGPLGAGHFDELFSILPRAL